MLCSISGEIPKFPVVSAKSGHVFERELVTKYIEEFQKCPVTGVALDVKDLIEIKNPKLVSRTPTSTSIPSLLQMFQNEWDALMLDNYELKKKNQELKSELATSLYQYDAACRVIARLTKERDQAREALGELQQMKD